IMSKRTHGKAGFMHIQDASGRIQIYGSLDALGEEAYDLFKKLDVGDIVGVQGEVFITKTGEISIRAGEVTILAKCLRPLPEKWHGLRDVELRYRQRYLDLIVNPGVQRVFLLRSSIIRAIREFLDGRGFIEVETPAMHVIPGGAAARPFVTHHNALDMDLYLRIALELHLKRLLVGGLERVYEIGRVFRNEGISTRHNPEFTMLELYQSYSDYHEMMELTEQLLCYVANRALGTAVINYQGNEIDLTPPWPRITLTEIISRYTGVDITRLRTEDDARREAERLGLTVMPGTTRGKIINEIFENLVEPRLISPTFVVDYPVDISPLAKRREDNPELTYRFEAFVAGMEVA
ncbi:MAG: lysine--tRNA ligase, partial [Clostridia bacterium]|nr:lysine--tRNA ligase [Clostridia bacterium]